MVLIFSLVALIYYGFATMNESPKSPSYAGENSVSQAMTGYATQMQMTQIAEQIQVIQLAIEEVRQGQEYDRLASI